MYIYTYVYIYIYVHIHIMIYVCIQLYSCMYSHSFPFTFVHTRLLPRHASKDQTAAVARPAGPVVVELELPRPDRTGPGKIGDFASLKLSDGWDFANKKW